MLSCTKEVVLSLGSNLGDRIQNIKKAIEKLSQLPFQITKISSFYRVPPIGFSSGNYFLNGVLVGKTHLPPLTLLVEIKKIEASLGRKIVLKRFSYTDRTIDIDIIFYENEIINNKFLIIPHPLLHLRIFVLKPACEIIPFWYHPVLKKPINLLYNELIKFNNVPPVQKIEKIL